MGSFAVECESQACPVASRNDAVLYSYALCETPGFGYGERQGSRVKEPSVAMPYLCICRHAKVYLLLGGHLGSIACSLQVPTVWPHG